MPPVLVKWKETGKPAWWDAINDEIRRAKHQIGSTLARQAEETVLQQKDESLMFHDTLQTAAAPLLGQRE